MEIYGIGMNELVIIKDFIKGLLEREEKRKKMIFEEIQVVVKV